MYIFLFFTFSLFLFSMYATVLNFYIFISSGNVCRVTKRKCIKEIFLLKKKINSKRIDAKALASPAQVSTDRVATSVAEDHERMRHATRIVFSHLISAACRCRSLRSQVLGLLFARQKVATAETARRCMYVTASVRMRVHIFDVHPIFLFPIVWF